MVSVNVLLFVVLHAIHVTNPYPYPYSNPHPKPNPNPKPIPSPNPNPNASPNPNPNPSPSLSPSWNPNPNPNPNPSPNPNQAENIEDSLNSELYFYSKVFGFTAAGEDVTPFPIDNEEKCGKA